MLRITNRQRNANQNHHEISYHASQNGNLKSQETTDAGEAVEKWECFNIVGGHANLFNHWKTVW